VWPFHDAEQLQQKLDESGLIRKTLCNEATILCVNVRDMVDHGLKWFAEDPDTWYKADTLAWLQDARNACDSNLPAEETQTKGDACHG
jgi:hypothetical protein